LNLELIEENSPAMASKAFVKIFIAREQIFFLVFYFLPQLLREQLEVARSVEKRECALAGH
jgi:hypothetical protein